MDSDAVQMYMDKTKETKGTVVFTERLDPTTTDRERPHTFYILKDVYNQLGEPDVLIVTMEPQ